MENMGITVRDIIKSEREFTYDQFKFISSSRLSRWTKKRGLQAITSNLSCPPAKLRRTDKLIYHAANK